MVRQSAKTVPDDIMLVGVPKDLPAGVPFDPVNRRLRCCERCGKPMWVGTRTLAVKRATGAPMICAYCAIAQFGPVDVMLNLKHLGG